MTAPERFERRDHVFTLAEAQRFVRALRKRTYFVRGGCFLPTGEDKGFDGIANVRVSKRLAAKYIRDVLENFDKRGARIHVAELGDCVFIG